MASELDTKIEIRDARQIIRTPTVRISFHPDDRGFAFINCTVADDQVKEKILKLVDNYQQ
jgi:hypothetical protein